jgi:uncharacterized membrane protein required for colicin V production
MFPGVIMVILGSIMGFLIGFVILDSLIFFVRRRQEKKEQEMIREAFAQINSNLNNMPHPVPAPARPNGTSRSNVVFLSQRRSPKKK